MPGNRLIRRVKTRLANLLKLLSSSSRSSIQPLPTEVQPEEILSSFVFREDQIVRKTNTIHHSRLMPRRNPANQRLEVSVCRSSKLSEEQIWAICSSYFDPNAPAPAIGRGVGPASAVFTQKLAFDPDGKPYQEHANIIGWCDMADKQAHELKHFWMDQAQRMASQFSYVRRS